MNLAKTNLIEAFLSLEAEYFDSEDWDQLDYITRTRLTFTQKFLEDNES